jgi:C_GCAxxG_C_C family probable redox protein
MKEIIAEKAYELGFFYEKEYHGCAQCTLAALQEAFEMPDNSLFRAGSALAGGGCSTCAGSCGAYVGAVMFIGSLLGRRREFFSNDDDFKNISSNLAKELYDLFVQEYGTIICNQIHKDIFGRTYNFFDPVEKQQFEDDGAHTVKCTAVVAKAAKWCAELLYPELEKRGLLINKN